MHNSLSVDELHEYVKAKVHEVAPAMKPEFYPVKEGHTIRLAKAIPSDPKLKYRSDVESFSHNGEISPFGRMALDETRKQLKLSLEEADAIEDEVLRPQREHQQNLKRYEQAFIAAIAQEHPLSHATRHELKRLQQVWGLTDEDVASIEARRTLLEEPVHSPVVAKNVNLEPQLVESPPAAVSVPQTPPIKRKFSLLIGTGIAISIAAIAGFAFTIGLLIHRPLEEQPQGTQKPAPAPSENSQDCLAVVETQPNLPANIRSEPYKFDDNNILRGANDGEMLPATGKKTPKNWVQVKLRDGKLGWMHPGVIENDDELESCLQAKGILDKSTPDIEPPPSPSPSPTILDQVIPTDEPSVTISAFTTCPNSTVLYLLGETEIHRFAVCGEHGEPKYYIGESKKAGPPLTVPWSANGFIRGNVLYDPPFYGITHASNNKIRVYTNRNLQEYKDYEVIRLYKYPNIPATDSLSP